MVELESMPGVFPVAGAVMAMFGIGMILAVLLVVGVGVAVFSTMKGSRTVTWVLAGLLLLVVVAGVAVLLTKPSALDLEIVGPPGTSFVGEITVDGVSQTIRGTAPMTYYFPGRHIQYVIIVESEPDKTTLEVRSNASHINSYYGVRGELAREGPLMFTEMTGGLADTEWNATAARLLGSEGTDIPPPSLDPPPQP